MSTKKCCGKTINAFTYGAGQSDLGLIQEIDPSTADGMPVVESAWTITGGSG